MVFPKWRLAFLLIIYSDGDCNNCAITKKYIGIYNFSKCDVASGGMAVALKDHHRGRSTKYQCFLKYAERKY